ncbi:MAG: hypothetical protein EBZ69_04050 [Alphaproteobacteria bacterium]|nr:hypothetical protein [Alphaproteobacteria bacterium]NDC55970.1 hypothetical protein [Alphaproteobacteria bacterium]NDG04167.1 hypothetical protein [Alphaproteobacteria bacterium]
MLLLSNHKYYEGGIDIDMAQHAADARIRMPLRHPLHSTPRNLVDRQSGIPLVLTKSIPLSSSYVALDAEKTQKRIQFLGNRAQTQAESGHSISDELKRQISEICGRRVKEIRAEMIHTIGSKSDIPVWQRSLTSELSTAQAAYLIAVDQLHEKHRDTEKKVEEWATNLQMYLCLPPFLVGVMATLFAAALMFVAPYALVSGVTSPSTFDSNVKFIQQSMAWGFGLGVGGLVATSTIASGVISLITYRQRSAAEPTLHAAYHKVASLVTVDMARAKAAAELKERIPQAYQPEWMAAHSAPTQPQA